ncbi:MAG: FAD-dependent oxidoreductase [Phycisphaerae bacterium]|nr:FAD-dependent oxidoreductase [Phycisphaerae bacterium]
MSVSQHDLDALIIGGGIAGLWTLHELTRLGHSCLLVERNALGRGQTVWSQGIIHGGLKYTLAGMMNPSAEAIREMPRLWRQCLEGVAPAGPDLSAAGVRAQHCHLWQTSSIASRVGMIGARVGLRVAPVVLDKPNRPIILRECPGIVARLDEQVIDPAAVLRTIADQHPGRVVRGEIEAVTVENDGVRARVQSGLRSLTLTARWLVMSAGHGNAALRTMLGLHAERMQVRPLRMVMVRGEALPPLFGHCVDGAKTRLTITTAKDTIGRPVWQLGGEIAERAVLMSEAEAISFARKELLAVLPGLDLARCEFATYDAPRAEAAMLGLRRPDDAVVFEDGPLLTVFPTKLALAPRVAGMVASLVGDPMSNRAAPPIQGWDRPGVAPGPWESAAWRGVE